MLRTALVLGGDGFLGQHVVHELSTRGEYEPVSVSRRTGFDLLNITNVMFNLSSFKPVVIFNCAAHVGSVHYVGEHAAEVFVDNAQMALNLYRGVLACCPQAIVVNPIANCSYATGWGYEPQVESRWLSGPVHDSVVSYGNARRVLYYTGLCFNKQHGIQSRNLLVSSMFGPGDSVNVERVHALNGMIIRMLGAQKRGDATFEIRGSGLPVREWTYAHDVAEILVRSVQKSDLLSPVNIAQGVGYTIAESAKTIAEIIGYTGELVFNRTYADGAWVKILDNKEFQKVFPGFVFHDYRRGIQETVEYYRARLAEIA